MYTYHIAHLLFYCPFIRNYWLSQWWRFYVIHVWYWISSCVSHTIDRIYIAKVRPHWCGVHEVLDLFLSATFLHFFQRMLMLPVWMAFLTLIIIFTLIAMIPNSHDRTHTTNIASIVLMHTNQILDSILHVLFADVYWVCQGVSLKVVLLEVGSSWNNWVSRIDFVGLAVVVFTKIIDRTSVVNSQ